MPVLQQILDQRGISIRELARLCNVHPNTLNKYISNEDWCFTNGRLRVFWKIANGLEIHVENLIYGSDWQPMPDTVIISMSLCNAVDRKSVWLNTSRMEIHNQIREKLHLDNYATFSAYENYRWVPTIADALIIAEYLNCTIDALWGNYFRELENAG